jgi:hypothetical protein
MSKRQTAIDKAIAHLEAEIHVRQIAIDALEAQRAPAAGTPRRTRSKRATTIGSPTAVFGTVGAEHVEGKR